MLCPQASPEPHGHDYIAFALLGTNAEVNVEDGLGQTALHVAATHGRTAFVRKMLDSGGDVLAKAAPTGYTPAREAVSGGHMDAARLILRREWPKSSSNQEFDRRLSHVANTANRHGFEEVAENLPAIDFTQDQPVTFRSKRETYHIVGRGIIDRTP